jgi:histidyl-tRNA synthetase
MISKQKNKKEKSVPLRKNKKSQEYTKKEKKFSRTQEKKKRKYEGMRSVEGVSDILPEEYAYWVHIYRILDKAVREFGFRRIELPLIESLHIYKKSIGEKTIFFEKEICGFTTKEGENIVLRPEMTSGLIRSFIENDMRTWIKPIKLFSCGSLFQIRINQRKKYREFKQAHFDVFGEPDPILDAQLIQMASRVLSGLGLKNMRFLVNTLGSESDRKEYAKLLSVFFKSKKTQLCSHCKALVKSHPLHILRCGEFSCRSVSTQAPHMIDHLSQESHDHFKYVLEYLDELEVPYELNPFLIPALDYYNDTVFEIVSFQGKDSDREKFHLGRGGRSDSLIKKMGGEDTSAMGFELDLDRIVFEMKHQETKIYTEPKPRVFLVQLGELAKKKSLKLFEYLEKNGILMAESFGRGSLKGQLRQSVKMGADLTIILGQKEAMDQTVIVKNMQTGSQETMPQDKVVEFIKYTLKKNGK